MLLLGVIPGPHEPKLHINYSFLQPLVDDLLKFCNGVILQTCSGTCMQQFVQGALLCDISTARKVYGFVGHGCTRGCSRYLARFSTIKFKKNLII